MLQKNLTLVDALTLVLKDLGVRFVFGVSGANIEHFHDAIYRLGENKLSSVLTKSEFSAAYMADGYARTHATLGVCCATSGGGMTNLAVGIAEAYADNVPLLAIVGQPPTALEGKGAFQDSSGKNNTVDSLMFWQAISKYVAKVTQPEEFWSQLEAALKRIFNKNFGPSVLLIPRDLFSSPVSPRPIHFSTHLNDYRSFISCNQNFLMNLYNALSNAKKPLVLLGKYIRYYQVTEKIRNFVSIFNCKVVTTLADINAFDHHDPHYLGMVGVCGHANAHQYLKNEADLVIIIEDDCSVMTTTGIEKDLNNIQLAYIGSDASKARSTLNINFILEGEVNSVLNQLLAQASHNNSDAHLATNTNKSILKSNFSYTKYRDSEGLAVTHTLPLIAKFLPKVKHVIFDAGNCVATAAHYLNFPANVKSVITLGMGGMGYAIPAAIGAQLGSVSLEKTIVFTGDGGFLISGLEIHTAIEFNLPILFIVFNNNRHGMCVTRQQLYFSNRVTASTYATINIADVVKGLGDNNRIWCGCVDTPTDLEDSLSDYYNHHYNKTGVLEIKIKIDEMPPFIPFLIEASKNYKEESNKKLITL